MAEHRPSPPASTSSCASRRSSTWLARGRRRHLRTAQQPTDCSSSRLQQEGLFRRSDFVNEYHEHEFFLDEFETMLRRWFAHVEMLGQHVAGVSFAWPLGHDDNGVTFVGDRRATASPGRSRIWWSRCFIALCSASPIDIGRADLRVPRRRESLIAGYEDSVDRAGRLERRCTSSGHTTRSSCTPRTISSDWPQIGRIR
jgi:hypothetical protein